MMEILNVKSLSKKYVNGDNEFWALNNVNFKVNKGEFVAIVGKVVVVRVLYFIYLLVWIIRLLGLFI